MGQKKFDNREQMVEFRLALERAKTTILLAMAFQAEAQKVQQALQSLSQMLGIPVDKNLNFDYENLTVSWED